MVSDEPFTEKEIPENPVWMKQPSKDAEPASWLKPKKFIGDDYKTIDGYALLIGLVIFAIFMM